MRYFTTSFMLALSAITAMAQAKAPSEEIIDEVINDTKIIYVGKENSADTSAYREHLLQFYEDQFRHVQDPHAPYFLLMNRNGNIGMGIGGQLKLIGAYDWNGSMDGVAFCPYDIPMSVSPTAKNLLQATAGRSSIYFTVFGKNKVLGMYRVYIEGKFKGAGGTFKLNKAYATFGDWTLGYTNTTFEDPMSQPATIDIQGPNSEVGDKRVLVRFMHKMKNDFTYALSVEMPTTQLPSSSYYKPINTYAPDVAAFLQYQKGREHVRLSAIISPMGYRDLVKNENHHTIGWGVNLGTMFRPVSPLTVYGAIYGGQGIGDLVNDLSCGNNDLLGYSDNHGKMYAPWSFGWYAALQYNYSPKVFSTVMFSQERLFTKSNTIDDNGALYKYGLYATANVFWNLTSRMQIGAECNIGKRHNIDGDQRWAYRASLLAQFSF